jgi:hypothetical protein
MEIQLKLIKNEYNKILKPKVIKKLKHLYYEHKLVKCLKKFKIDVKNISNQISEANFFEYNYYDILIQENPDLMTIITLENPKNLTNLIENSDLIKTDICIICYDNTLVCNLNCHNTHLLCLECYNNLGVFNKKCPLCRTKIEFIPFIESLKL